MFLKPKYFNRWLSFAYVLHLYFTSVYTVVRKRSVLAYLYVEYV